MCFYYFRESCGIIIVLYLLVMTTAVVDCKTSTEESNNKPIKNNNRLKRDSSLFNHLFVNPGGYEGDEPLDRESASNTEPKYEPPARRKSESPNNAVQYYKTGGRLQRHRDIQKASHAAEIKPNIPSQTADTEEHVRDKYEPEDTAASPSLDNSPLSFQLPNYRKQFQDQDDTDNIIDAVKDWRKSLIDDTMKMDKQMTLITKMLGYQRRKLKEAMAAESNLLSKIIMMLAPRDKLRKGSRSKRDTIKNEGSEYDKIKSILKYVERSKLRDWILRINKLSKIEKAQLLLYLSQFRHLKMQNAISYKSAVMLFDLM